MFCRAIVGLNHESLIGAAHHMLHLVIIWVMGISQTAQAGVLVIDILRVLLVLTTGMVATDLIRARWSYQLARILRRFL